MTRHDARARVSPLPLDPIVAAAGRDGRAPNVHGLLAALSHLDPDHRPLEHARVWREIQAADARAGRS